MIRVATDVGGTFTDFVAFDDESGSLTVKKCPTSTDVVEGIVDCFDRYETPVSQVRHFVHGSTVAINTVIERKGAKCGHLTTKGFRDILEIGRGNIPNAFDLLFATPEPLIPRSLRLEIEERMAADGRVLTPLNADQASRAIEALLNEGVEAVAICLLHSYANTEHERLLKAIIEKAQPEMFVSASSDITRQYREFERTSTVALNAYVGPRVAGYLNGLQTFLGHQGFRGDATIMQSSGGTMTIDSAKVQPVRMMESGPVGGTIAAAHLGEKLGRKNIVAFDMGGTTAKVSIVQDGKIQVADGYYIGGYASGYPLQLPVVDVFEVGAGGGSVAYVADTGALKVGPVSAGAVPGPACYDRGGARPAVTDADLLLGRLNPEYFLGGEIRLRPELAREAVERHICRPLGLDLNQAAAGIAKLADTTMAQALRAMTVERGYDPRDFALVAYGGAGPSHAVSLARELNIKTVIIPPHPGVFSAVGMLLTDGLSEYVRSYVRSLQTLDPQELERLISEMEREGRASMERAGFRQDQIGCFRSLEMRYIGQEFTLIVDLPEGPLTEATLADLTQRFHHLHERRYGHAFQHAVPEMVSLRLHARGRLAKPELQATADGSAGHGAGEGRRVFFEGAGFVEASVYRRDRLAPYATVHGPAVIEEISSTTVIGPKDVLRVDDMGNLVVQVK